MLVTIGLYSVRHVCIMVQNRLKQHFMFIQFPLSSKAFQFQKQCGLLTFWWLLKICRIKFSPYPVEFFVTKKVLMQYMKSCPHRSISWRNIMRNDDWKKDHRLVKKMLFVLSCAVVLWTKVSSFRNLVPKTAMSQKGLQTCSLFVYLLPILFY